MKMIRMLMILVFIAVQPGVTYAGQADKKENKGTGTEPECEHITLPDFMQ